MHWVRAWGIVDNDRRAEEDITRLRELGIHALTQFSVESLYYHPKMIHRVAARTAQVTGDDPTEMAKRAIVTAVREAERRKMHFVRDAVERLVRREIFANLPKKKDIENVRPVLIEVDTAALSGSEERAFDRFVEDHDLSALLQRYPLRESGALSHIATGCGLPSRDKYESAVRMLLQHDGEALAFLRGLFGDLPAEILQ
jgi:hypothetical protein